MRKLTLLLILLISISTLGAQTRKTTFYAIDGSTWLTSADRDRKEELLWTEIDINLQAALTNGRLGQEKGQFYHDILQKLFQQCKISFSTIRIADSGRDALQNAEFRFYLSQNGVRARLGEARNGEIFNFEEYGNSFNSVLREYSFNAKIVEDLASPNGAEYNLDFVVTDFTERMEIVQDEWERNKRDVELKEVSIRYLLPKFKDQKRQRR